MKKLNNTPPPLVKRSVAFEKSNEVMVKG
jgi:hypothetical protein